MWRSDKGSRLSEKQILERLRRSLYEVSDRLLASKNPDQAKSLVEQFLANLGEEEVVTGDGYKADFVVRLRDRVWIFEIDRATVTDGELGFEAIPASAELRKSIQSRLKIEVQLVFISPKGAPKYVADKLLEVSDSIAVPSNFEFLEPIFERLVKEWLADKLKPGYEQKGLYEGDTLMRERLAQISEQDKREVFRLMNFMGLSRLEVCKHLNKDADWVNAAWRMALQEVATMEQSQITFPFLDSTSTG